MFTELLQARRALGPRRKALEFRTAPALRSYSMLPQPQPQPQPQPPPPSDTEPSLWMNASSFLAREVNRVAWRRRNAHLL